MDAASATFTDIRLRELDLRDRERAAEVEKDRKNAGPWTQTYPQGWKRIVRIARENPRALELYVFFAEHLEPGCGAVVADQAFLAERMGVSVRTVQRWLSWLEEHGAIVRIPVAGRVCAYALDPREVWRGYDTSKSYAAFTTKTLTNRNGEVDRRLRTMLGKKSQEELDL